MLQGAYEVNEYDARALADFVQLESRVFGSRPNPVGPGGRHPEDGEQIGHAPLDVFFSVFFQYLSQTLLILKVRAFSTLSAKERTTRLPTTL